MSTVSIEQLYLTALRRPPDPHARVAAERGFAAGTLTPTDVLAQLVSSDEFRRLRALDTAIAHARGARDGDRALHGLAAPAGTDERVIEIPWVLSRYRGERRVLDIGSVNADRAYLDALLELAPAAIGVDIVPGTVAGMDLRLADVRCLPFPTGSFDVVFCVSTLEHIGANQAVYGVADDPDPDGVPRALSEIRRVLDRGGRALVTVPCGREEDHGWFVQHTRDSWNRLFARAELLVADQELYVLHETGWCVGRDDCCRYGERGPAASAVLCTMLRRARRLRPRLSRS